LFTGTKIKFNIKELGRDWNLKNSEPEEFKTVYKEGSIVKKLSNYVKELFSNGGHYKLRFPPHATVDHKVLLIAATMLLDMNHYDK
jgi:hypothetical protein